MRGLTANTSSVVRVEAEKALVKTVDGSRRLRFVHYERVRALGQNCDADREGKEEREPEVVRSLSPASAGWRTQPPLQPLWPEIKRYECNKTILVQAPRRDGRMVLRLGARVSEYGSENTSKGQGFYWLELTTFRTAL